jgi:hypothetical protein
MGTTFATIRDAQAAVIVGLTPTVRADVSFREHLGESPYYDWVQQNPTGCLRRFEIRNGFDIEPGPTSDGNLEDYQQTLTVFVSYPAQFAGYGLQNNRDADDFVEQDLRLIDANIGRNGYSNYVSGQHLCTLEGTALERGTSAWVLALTFRILYDRSI